MNTASDEIAAYAAELEALAETVDGLDRTATINVELDADVADDLAAIEGLLEAVEAASDVDIRIGINTGGMSLAEMAELRAMIEAFG